MPVLLASKSSNLGSSEETRKARKAELEAGRAEREKALEPHIGLLKRMKALLPPDSPDRLGLDVLRFLIDITPEDKLELAIAGAGWEVDSKPFVVIAPIGATVAA